jgi:predicted phage terminase large subunit-like protein
MNDDLMSSILRTDFAAFNEKVFMTLNPGVEYHDNWHIHVIGYQLRLCAEGKNKRLIILLPPRHLKSLMVLVAFPAFLLGHDPSTKILAASYNQELATKFSIDVRAIMAEPWYQNAFPHTRISKSKDTQSYFETTMHGMRFATSVNGPMTGFGGDFIIIDDPLKASDAHSEIARKTVNDWYDQTVATRLNDPKAGSIGIVMQRLHVDDLVGHVTETDGKWNIVKMPAIAEEDGDYTMDAERIYYRNRGEFLQPSRLGRVELDERRRALGSAAFYAQYQQAPIPPEGNIFKWEWFKSYERAPDFSELIMSVDVAATDAGGNYSAFTVWGHRDEKLYFVAAHKYQLDLPAVRKQLIKLDEMHRPDIVIIDSNGIGRGLLQQLSGEGMKHVLGFHGKGKEFDAHGTTPMIEAGNVLFPSTAPGLADFRNEVIAFPNGKYSDQVDSMVQLLKQWRVCVARARRFKRPERREIRSTIRPTLEFKVTNIGISRRLVRY